MKDKKAEKAWWRSPSTIGDIATTLAATIAIVLTALDLFDLLEVGWFQSNLPKITVLLVSLVVISDVVERRYLITAIKNKLSENDKPTDLLPTDGFVQGVVDALKRNNNCESLAILASTSTLYFYAFRDASVEVKNVRLLLRSTKVTSDLRIPSATIAKQYVQNETYNMVESWLRLHKTGRVKNLEIRFYLFDPMYHFMIIDKKLIHFGFFQPKHELPGAEILSSYIAENSTVAGLRLLNDFETEFDTIWNEFAHTVDMENGRIAELAADAKRG